MSEDNKQRKRLIITEYEEKNGRHPTTEARSQLYRLIANFRKNAETADDPETRIIFEFATEVISGLARAFRQHEDQADEL